MSLLQRVLAPLADSRREETVTALLMFGYSFLAMTAYNIIQPLTRSKLISSLGAVNVPWVIFGSGLVIGVLENMVGGYLSSAFKEIAGFMLILVVLMVRPFGLFGEKRIERV